MIAQAIYQKPLTLDMICTQGYILSMECQVEYSDEFEQWWETLNTAEQIDVAAHVELLEKKGPHLPFPYSSGINQSRHSHMRELRVQHRGRPYRVLYAFDPRRVAILLLGGDKTGEKAWYRKWVPIADKLFDQHLLEIKNEHNTDKKGHR